MLPTEAPPVLIFLGVDSSGQKAVWLVDSSLTVTGGEGTCSPSVDSCATVALEPGELQRFSNGQGGSYELQIDQIREVRRSQPRAPPPARSSAPRRRRPRNRYGGSCRPSSPTCSPAAGDRHAAYQHLFKGDLNAPVVDRAVRLAAVLGALLLPGAAEAKTSKRQKAYVPDRLVSPMRVRVGRTIDRGKGFSRSRKRNTVLFKSRGSR